MEYLQDVFVSNFNVSVNNGGFITIPQNTPWHIAGERFNQNKFYFIRKGQCTIGIEEKEYIAREGDWFFIPANAYNYYTVDNSTVFEKYWMHFDIYPTDINLFSKLNLPYFVKAAENAEVLQLFETYTKTKGDYITDIIKVKVCLLSLLERYIELSEKSDILVRSRMDDRIDKVLRYISDNLHRPIENKELSDICYLHPNYFVRFFKEITGQTPSHYIKCRKLDVAKRLIETSDLNISEVMERVGFNDISYFSKMFKSIYEMSPREYKKYYKFNQLPAEKQNNV